MIEIIRKRGPFVCEEIWFAEKPVDINNCDYVTFKGYNNCIDAKDFETEEFSTSIIDLTQELDVIWKKMDKSSCRWAINKAEKEGIKVDIAKSQTEFDEFYEMYLSFLKNKKLGAPIGKKYLLDGILFIAKLNDELLAGNLYFSDGHSFRWYIGASKRLIVDKQKASLIGCANKLLVWDAIKYAKSKGTQIFDLGGVYLGENKNDERIFINKFKLSFGGEYKVTYNYIKYYSRLLKFFGKNTILVDIIRKLLK